MDSFFLAQLRTGGAQIGAAHAQILRSNFKSAAGTGRVFFENQSNILSLQIAVGDTGLFLALRSAAVSRNSWISAGVKSSSFRKLSCFSIIDFSVLYKCGNAAN